MSANRKPKARPMDSADAPVSTERIRQRLTVPPTKSGLSAVLAKSLAAYVILRSKEPISEVINDLFEIEIEAASLVESFYSDDKCTMNLKGSLASVFSFVPIGGRKFEKDVSPKKSKALRPRSSTMKKKKTLRSKK